MIRDVATPSGPARLWVDDATAPTCRLVLGHGAGGGPQARDLAALARALPDAGVTVVRVEQPWRVAGKRIAPRPPKLDEAWLAALAQVPRDLPLVVGGRSAGARVACRTARALGAVGVVALAFPLHLPGKPERSRIDELTGSGVPTLIVQGERDTFGRPGEFPSDTPHLVSVPLADHSMAVSKTADPAEPLSVVVTAVTQWLHRLVPPGESNRTERR
ncbi:MAG TPA: alpha/beta family hydrolase [Jiangellaceae bacterium]|nr:alpha/beta family hydrolase [Jiangellaceae bacterium]